MRISALAIALVVFTVACGSDEEPLSAKVGDAVSSTCPDAAVGTKGVLAFDCHLDVLLLDDGGLTVRYTPDEDDPSAPTPDFGKLGDVTGCWSSTDVAKMGATRALDGRVESTNGRSSWTFHPDSGLTIVCDPDD